MIPINYLIYVLIPLFFIQIYQDYIFLFELIIHVSITHLY